MLTEDQIVGAVKRLQTGSETQPEMPQTSALWRRKWFSGIEPRHADVESSLEAAERFFKRFVRDDPGGSRLLVLSGETGTGKTMIARRLRSMAGMLGDWPGVAPGAGVRSRLIHWPSLAETKTAEREGSEEWQVALGSHFVVLDDVGAEIDQFRSGICVENLRFILEARRRKWTVVSTNVPEVEWETRWDKRVWRRLSDGVDASMPTVGPWNRRTV